MRQLSAFLRKEGMELIRTGKIWILLIIFILFGIMNPAIAKLTPWMVETMSDSLAESGMVLTEVKVNAMTSWNQFYKNISMALIIFALMLTEWVGMSRIARAEMLKLKDQEFVLASRTLGAGSFFIIFKEVLPNIIGPIITQVMFSIPTAIFTEAFLSFVGLGIPVPQCSLGSLISELYNSFTTHPYQIIPPIVVMSLLMLSFNLLADGLREALDPKMKSM